MEETCRGSIILAVTTGAGLVILLRAKLGVPELSPETVLKRELSMESTWIAIINLPSPPQMLHFYTLAALLSKETSQADQSPTAWFTCAAHLNQGVHSFCSHLFSMALTTLHRCAGKEPPRSPDS